MRSLKIITLIIIFSSQILLSKIINGEAKYRFGDNETVIQAKKKCKVEALRNAVETFATYIESETIVTNYKLSKEVIISRAMALVQNVKAKEENVDRLNSIIYYRISGEIDEKEVLETLKKQSADNTTNIKFSEKYYFGEGFHSDYRNADKQAIGNLIINIADDLQNQFADIKPQEKTQYDFTESVMNTYKSSFARCKRKSKKDDNNKNVILRYIKKSDLKEIFKPRKKKINNYIAMAFQAEDELRIGDALRYYYWALSLLRSHPEHNQMILPFFSRKLLLLAIPEKINSIFNNLSFNISNFNKGDNYKQITLNILYKGIDIQNINYSYFLGDDWSVITSGKNGLGVCEFNGVFSKSIRKIKLNIEYRYESKSKIDQELKTVLEGISLISFPSSSFEIDLSKEFKGSENRSRNRIKIKEFNFKKDSPTGIYYQSIDEKIILKCQNAIEKIVDGINKKEYNSLKKYFTTDGYDSFIKIIKYGKAKLISNQIQPNWGVINNNIVVRSIPMRFRFPNNNFETNENIVFTFNNKGKIDALSLALSTTAIRDIMGKPEQFASLSEKLQLLQFMEYYKTAYCLKRMDYIKQIFADNALIIVGKVLKQGKPIGEMYDRLGEKKVSYLRMKKKEYISHLELVFKSNEFINIQFEENKIKRLGGKDKIYGIQIKQNYYSTNYADQGYLFLMLDLSDSQKPKIYVRSWQPQKKLDGSIIGLADFTM